MGSELDKHGRRGHSPMKKPNTAHLVEPQTTKETLLTIETLAEYLSVPLSSIYTLRSRGKLPPAFKVGTLVRWPKSRIDKWLAEQDEAQPAGDVSEHHEEAHDLQRLKHKAIRYLVALHERVDG